MKKRLFSVATSLAFALFFSSLAVAETSDPSLLALWHFDEGSGSSAADSAGSSTGSLSGNATWVAGRSGTALHFEGSSYVTVKSAPVLGSAPNFTVEAWIKWDGIPTGHQHQMIYCEGSYNDVIDILLDEGYPSFITLGGNWQAAKASAPLSAGVWHHLAAVLESGVGGALYVDGQLAASNPAMEPAAQYAGETDIGRFAGNGGSRYFAGIIDEVRVYAGARSAGQIAADVQAFPPPQRTLSVTRSGNGSGSITPDSGSLAWNGAAGTASYTDGAQVSLTATADTGSTFTGWSGGCTGTGSCTLTLAADTAVTATFTLQEVPAISITSVDRVSFLPLSPVTVAGSGLDPAAPTFVRFYNQAQGFSLSVPAAAVTSTGVKVFAPPFITAAGSYGSGTVSVQVLQTTVSGTKSSNSLDPLEIQPLPSSPFPAGTVTYGLIKGAAEVATLFPVSGTAYDTPQMNAALSAQISALQSVASGVKSVMDATAGTLSLGTLNGNEVTVGSGALQDADRLALAMLRSYGDFGFPAAAGREVAAQGVTDCGREELNAINYGNMGGDPDAFVASLQGWEQARATRCTAQGFTTGLAVVTGSAGAPLAVMSIAGAPAMATALPSAALTYVQTVAGGGLIAVGSTLSQTTAEARELVKAGVEQLNGAFQGVAETLLTTAADSLTIPVSMYDLFMSSKSLHEAFSATPVGDPQQEGITWNLTVGITGSGTVSPSPGGASCGAGCSTHPAGTPVALTASPAEGWEFTGWSGACSGSGACSVTLTADTSVGALFTELPPSCSYTLTPAGASFLPKGGKGSFTFSVQPPTGCPAAAPVASDGWITVLSVRRGTVRYAVQRNTVTDPRSGSITIGNRSFTVSQAEANPTITPGTTSITFLKPAIKTLKVKNTGDDLLNIGTVGISGDASFSVALDGCSGKTLKRGKGCSVRIAYAPTSPEAHAATLNLPSNDTDNANAEVALYAPETLCSYSLSAAGKSMGAAGGSGTVAVTTAAACGWTAASDASWLTVTGSGSGKGAVSYSVAPNGGSSRTGTITVGSRTFTVTQVGTGSSGGTTVSVAPTSVVINAPICFNEPCTVTETITVSSSGSWTLVPREGWAGCNATVDRSLKVCPISGGPGDTQVTITTMVYGESTPSSFTDLILRNDVNLEFCPGSLQSIDFNKCGISRVQVFLSKYVP